MPPKHRPRSGKKRASPKKSPRRGRRRQARHEASSEEESSEDDMPIREVPKRPRTVCSSEYLEVRLSLLALYLWLVWSMLS